MIDNIRSESAIILFSNSGFGLNNKSFEKVFPQKPLAKKVLFSFQFAIFTSSFF